MTALSAPAVASAVDAVVQVLRARILDGMLGPGARIVEAETAAELGVSRHTLRAAMRQLTSDGLLCHEPHRGVRVPVLTASDIADVYRLRAVLEQEAVRDVAARGDAPEAAVTAVAALEALAPDARWHEVVEHDLRFHRAIVDATGSVRLARTYSAALDEILFCLVQLRPHYNRPVDVALEHRELLEPIAAGDVREASRRLAVHLADAQANLLGSLPDASTGGVRLASAIPTSSETARAT